MFTKKRENELERLDDEINNLFEALRTKEPYSEEYDAISDQLDKLIDLKSKISSQVSVSPDVMIGVAANLAGILMILNYERVHVITTKALGFVSKLR